MPVQVKSETELSRMPSMPSLAEQPRRNTADSPECRVVQSPFKLIRVRDLPANANVDTTSVRDILGDVMLKEVWLFDFLYDVDWVM